MSLDVFFINQTIHSDPVLSHFEIDLVEDEAGGRWSLEGVAPTEGLKRRAGSIAKQLSPASVWVVNRIIVEPDQFASEAAA